ncbi:copper transporter [Actinobacteria bacterium YIM 96077]|uniref:Copper transporter n=1 Tax=Phytoactinopolyspora halophila TaxID=1981511 RepID=A0A329QEC5_9ACTN|nr:copper transporter [Phytoactinopolyspora halophila]AYY13617.1 copper transporter [Actinobacteria bacterium YIM 96077]RAW10717.1 hypothetical protein DPM12_18485 [Phytoactinopolyspora halophila]
MIDFRYHLVSIIAIFFALATGIVLGAGPLSETIDDTLADQTSQLREENRRLHDELDTANEEHAYQEAFVNEVTPRLVAEQLEGENVAVIALPGAEDQIVTDVQEALQNSGATAELLIRIEPSWTDPDSEPVLDQLATDLVSSGTELGEGNGFDRGATVLASALLSRPADAEDGLDDAPQTVDTTVVSEYEDADLIELEQDTSTAPTLAVAIAGPVSGDDAEERYVRLTSLTQALDEYGDGVVLAGPSSTAEGGLLTALRNGDVGEDVSTVDVGDLPSGRVAVVFALTEQQHDSVGHYGIVGDIDGALPPVPGGESDESGGSDGESDDSSEDSGDEPDSGDAGNDADDAEDGADAGDEQ